MLKFKEDWSLAYLMYYLFRISFWLNLFIVILQIIIMPLIFQKNNSLMTLKPIPVSMDIEGLTDLKNIETDNLTLNISKTIRGSVFIKANYKENIPEFIYLFLLQFLDYLALILILYFVSKLLKNVAEGNPFHEKNPQLLFIIGWIMFLTSIFYMAIAYLPVSLFDSVNIASGIEIKSILYSDNGYMAGGILAIIFGYVFKEASKIYEEQKLTV